MSDWGSGYVTEVNYTHGLYRELNPLHLAFAALMKGIACPGLSTSRLRVLELGCGQGVSANLLAAANPHLDYTAVDFNPAHIVGAKNLAAAAGTSNIEFLEMSFADLTLETLVGEYDIITVHGIYTWVSEENRAHIRRIVRDRLRPGGSLYLSYNTYPGWGPVVPIQRLFTDIAADLPSAPIFERLDAAFSVFDRLKLAGARAIVTIPGLAERIDKARALPKHYVAHEYFNKKWTIFFFSDVARDMGEAKLNFAASANFLDHVDEINLSPDQKNILKEIKDPIRRESIRDFIVNQSFRKDIFIRGALPIGAITARECWLNMRFALVARAEDVELRVKGSLGEAELQGDTYRPLLAALAEGPKTMKDLLAMPAPVALDVARLQQALVILAGKGAIEPSLPNEGEDMRSIRTDAFNTAVMLQSRENNDINFLASPVTGGGVGVDRLGQLFLLAHRDGADPVRFIWDTFNRQGQRLVHEGKILQTESENLLEIENRLMTFREKVMPVLATLKIK